MQQDYSYEAQVLDRYIRGIASPEETAQLFAWLRIADPESMGAIEQILEKAYVDASAHPGSLSEDKRSKILANLLSMINREETLETPKFKIYASQYKRIRYSVAAAVLVIIFGTYWFLSNQEDKKQPPTAYFEHDNIAAPATNRAMITLADGSRVYLDSVDNGQLAQLGNIKLIKLANGQIVYQMADGQIMKELQHNTLTNPRGSKVVDIQLADGSHIWLNAGSSITYPVSFVNNERKVVLRGEGYFEVAKHPSKKFVVEANGLYTEVLGTHFNINAYSDNKAIKVTLLEGAVRLKRNTESLMIKPGQQGIAGATALSLLNLADIDQVIAWKNGIFNLNSLSFDEVMQEFGNWYDIEIVYPSGVPQIKLFGEMERSLSLAEVLESLTEARIKWKLEGKRLIIHK